MRLRSGVSDLGKSYTFLGVQKRGGINISKKQYFTPLVCSETSLAGTAVKQLKAGRLFWLLTCKWADHTLKLCMFHLPSHSFFPARDKLETLAQRWNIIIPFPVPQSNTFPCSESDWKHWPGGEKRSICSPDSSRLWPRQRWNRRLLSGRKKLPSCPRGLKARWDVGSLGGERPPELWSSGHCSAVNTASGKPHAVCLESGHGRKAPVAIPLSQWQEAKVG